MHMVVPSSLALFPFSIGSALYYCNHLQVSVLGVEGGMHLLILYSGGSRGFLVKMKPYERRKDATIKLSANKVATRRDAEVVKQAELWNNQAMTVTDPVGVSASVAAAARLNQQYNNVNDDI